MQNITLNNNDLTILPSLSTNFTNTELAHKYPSVKIISTENFHPKCIICMEIPEDPVSLCNKVALTLDERHLFCRKCTDEYKNSTCPMCKESLTEDSEFIEDKQARRTINDMKYNVICICPKNCGDTLRLTKLEAHLELCCGEQTLIDRKVSPEMNACAVIKCSKCKTKLTNEEQIDFKKHKQQCPEEFVEWKHINSTLPPLFVRNRLLNNTRKEESARCAEHFIHSHIVTNTQKELLSMPIYEFAPSDEYPSERKFIFSTVYITIDEQNLLFIKKPEDYAYYDAVINNKYDDDIPLEEVPMRFRNREQQGFYIESFNFHKLKYQVSIYAYLSSIEKVLMSQQSFTFSQITTLNSMYRHNKIDTPQSFIDFKEFFTDKGLSKWYVDKFGASITWRIEISELQG
jgi:hypothetical protein